MKITKNQRIETLELKVAGLTTMLTMLQVWSDHADRTLNELIPAAPEPKPQLKQLDQSVFDGLEEKWRFAAVSGLGMPFVYDYKPTGNRVRFSDDAAQQKIKAGKVMRIDEYGYDTTNWQNSLIERDDIAKKLAEVDLSSELTGSELCKAMLERGDKIVTCAVKNYENDLNSYDAIIAVSSNGRYYESTSNLWSFAVPINNDGEPLTASEVGL